MTVSYQPSPGSMHGSLSCAGIAGQPLLMVRDPLLTVPAKTYLTCVRVGAHTLTGVCRAKGDRRV